MYLSFNLLYFSSSNFASSYPSLQYLDNPHRIIPYPIFSRSDLAWL